MKKIIFFSLFLAGFMSTVSSQLLTPGQTVYKGSIDGKYNITMYLAVEDPCGGNPYTIGMYKYDDQEEWIELTIVLNEEESRYCMVEYLFTGVMILKQNASTLEGSWIGPDGEKELPVKLQKTTISEAQKEELAEILNLLFYNHNDC